MPAFKTISFRFAPLFLSSILCLAGSTELLAQPALPSPLSRYGVGEVTLSAYGQQRVIGGLGQAWQPITALNPANPASLGSLRLSTFDFGLYAGSSRQDNGSSTSRQPVGNISNVALGFPIWEKKMALSFAIQPYSRVNYSISQIPDSVTESNPGISQTGEGGLNQISFGLGYNVMKNLNVGASVSRLFGTIRHQAYSEYGTGNTLNNFLDTRNSLGGVQAKLGAQYTLALKNDQKLLFGLTFVPQTSLRNSLSTALVRYRVGELTQAVTIEDTVYYAVTSPSAKLASEIHAGLSYAPNGRWWFGGEYTTSPSTQTFLDESGQWQRNRSSMALGVTHTPKLEAGQKGYFRRVTYRAGLRITQLPVEINGQGVDETSISAGVVLPFFKTFSVLTVGGEVGQRSGAGDYKEQYVLMHVSATLSDRWFIKRKYD